jgi:hypothetical protein
VVADVVVVGIDEATLDAFPEPFALWHEPLAEVFAGLAAASPRAVGVDVALPERSYDTVRPGSTARWPPASRCACSAAGAGDHRRRRGRPKRPPFPRSPADGTGFALGRSMPTAACGSSTSGWASRRPLPTLVGTVARRLARARRQDRHHRGRGSGTSRRSACGSGSATTPRHWPRRSATASCCGWRAAVHRPVRATVNLAGWETKAGRRGRAAARAGVAQRPGRQLVSASPPLPAARRRAAGPCRGAPGARCRGAGGRRHGLALAASVPAALGYVVPVAGLLAASLLAATAASGLRGLVPAPGAGTIKASLSGYLSNR